MAAAMRALGLMSGTSMDGVDAALIETDGETIAGFGPSRFLPYEDADQDAIRARLGAWPWEEGLDALEARVRAVHAAAIANFGPLDVVGFHGQTLAHDPRGRGTHQIGRGDLLARDTGCRVVWDFRSADVTSGGQGAPLVPVFHYACARRIGADAPLAFLNLGGVGNVTWVNPRVPSAEAQGALLAFDTGPGNALIDDFVRARRGASHDAGGALARRGRVNIDFVERHLSQSYFEARPPKSLDRNDFRGLLEDLCDLSAEDGAATLAAFTVACAAAAARHFPEPVARWIVAGGGRHNAAVMAGLRGRANVPVEPAEAVGLDGDMLEAQAFGHLAVRVLRGLPTSLPSTTGARLPVCGGRVSGPG